MNFLPLESWGIPGFFIAALSSVIIYLNRKVDQKDQRIEQLQALRLQDAITSKDKLIEPLELIGRQSQVLYDKLINGRQ